LDRLFYWYGGVSDGMDIFEFPVAPVTAQALRTYAVYGDRYYAVSELQADGTPTVPEPATFLLFAAGLFGIGLWNQFLSAIIPLIFYELSDNFTIYFLFKSNALAKSP
jgi:hypothetical protein